MIHTTPLYSFSDIVMLPAETSEIDSRSQCNVYLPNGMLPLITAPMFSVINEHNSHLFINNSIHACLPRNSRDKWLVRTEEWLIQSYGLDEFLSIIQEWENDNVKHYALIDIANGHMQKLVDAVRKAKNLIGDRLWLMVGNIALPDTYMCLAQAGADAVRLGVGSGTCCITSANSSVHYPIASLIDECYKLKVRCLLGTEIIADGGFVNFDQIIKAIGLGADKVMCGSIFNKALQSAGKTTVKGTNCVVDQYSEEIKQAFKNGLELEKEYYGMSTKRAQREMGHETLKTSEGIVKKNRVEYTLGQWTENFKHYLSTAMSYTGKKTLEEFRGNVDFNVVTPQAFQAFIK